MMEIKLHNNFSGTLALRKKKKTGSLLISHLYKELKKARDGKDFFELITCAFCKISESSIELESGQTPEMLSNASIRLVLERPPR